MIIVVDGVDLAGKGFFLEKITKAINKGMILKNSYKPKKKEDTSILLTQYINIINLIGKTPISPIFLDRFYPSQMVYSFLRGKDEFNEKCFLVMDRILAHNNWKYIWVDTELKFLKERYINRGDEHIKITDLEILQSKYKQFFDWTNLKKIRIDTREPNFVEEFLEFIK